MAALGPRLGHLVKRAGNRALSTTATTITSGATSKDATFFKLSEVADAYVKFRPAYGPQLLHAVVSFCEESVPATRPFSLALDVGCGSGQSTVPLTQRFQRVIGVDVSEEQIARAPTHLPNLSFRVGPAEDLSFVGSGTVDLVTVAAALHWLDLERFYAEVERVLKPGGVLVAYCYNKPSVDEIQAQEIINHLYRDVLRNYWPEAVVSHVDTRYRTLALPFPGFRRKDDLKIERRWTVDELVGFMWSWTSYQKYLKDHPASTVMTEIKHRLREVYHQGGRGEERPVRVTWSIFMIMGRKPSDSL